MRLLLPPVRSCVPPWRQDGIRNPGGAEQGRVGAVCPALARCPGSHPRPVCATSPERFAPPMREKWTVEKSAGKTIPHLLAVRRALVPPVLARPGSGFYPPSGGASRAPVRLCRPWRRRESGDFRAAARTHSGRPGGRRSERRNARSPNVGIMMPLTKRTPSPGEQRKPPPFAPVSRCVGRMGPGRHPCPQNPTSTLVGAVWRKSETAAGTRFHPKTESEPTG